MVLPNKALLSGIKRFSYLRVVSPVLWEDNFSNNPHQSVPIRPITVGRTGLYSDHAASSVILYSIVDGETETAGKD